MKKYISLFLVAVLAILSVGINAIAIKNSTDSDLRYCEETKKLTAFGILDGDDAILYGELLTRGELAHYAVKMYGAAIDENAENVFSDVTEATQYRTDIIAAKELGIMNGTSNSEFSPDDNITLNELTKVMLTVLGYGELCEKRGGYPSGYIKTATEIDLYDNCGKTDKYVSTLDFLKIMLNTLNADAVVTESVETKKNKPYISFGPSSTQTLLSQNFGIYKSVGIMEACDFTSIYSGTHLSDGYITVGGHDYYTADAETYRLLGYEAEVYYKKDTENAEYEAVYIGQREGKNKVVSVNSRYIEENLTTTSKFVYEIDNDQKSVTVDSAASLIYNGKLTVMNAQKLCPENGDVTLIDNNHDSKADVVVVYDYKTVQVNAVSTVSMIVNDKLDGNDIKINDSDYLFIYKNGERISIDMINVGDIVSYAGSENGEEVKFLMVSDEVCSGKIEGYGEDSVAVNGKAYYINETLIDELNFEDEITLYLDYSGKIVAADCVKDYVYGFLTGIECKRFGRVRCRVFTENNRWVELTFKDKFEFNGTKKYDAEEFYNQYKDADSLRSLVRYNVNADGLITKLSYPTVIETENYWSDSEQRLIDDDVFRQSRTLSSGYYGDGGNCFGDKMSLSGSTKIFWIPSQTSKNKDDETNYDIVSLASLQPDYTYLNIKGFDANNAGVCNAVIIEGNKELSGDALSTSRIMIVDRVIDTHDGDGVDCKGIKGTYKDIELTMFVKDESLLNDIGGLSSGDIIQFGTDKNGKIASISLYYDASKGSNQKFLLGNAYSSTTKLAGEIKYIDHENNKIGVDYGTSCGGYSLNGIIAVYIYDADDRTLTKGSAKDITVGSHFFSKVRYLSLQEVVIFR